TPYTYTHYAHGGIPYLSYTHEGQGLGSVLEPNSDRLTLTAWLMPLTWLDLDLWGSLIRHGNASENYDRGDGSYYDDSMMPIPLRFTVPPGF
ncbi:MAG TPA: hypothetical protein VMX75_08580, partial [Spirochaetia bacterium]|nr:hypothetical protein [Spirochaetia bacterium]